MEWTCGEGKWKGVYTRMEKMGGQKQGGRERSFRINIYTRRTRDTVVKRSARIRVVA